MKDATDFTFTSWHPIPCCTLKVCSSVVLYWIGTCGWFRGESDQNFSTFLIKNSLFGPCPTFGNKIDWMDVGSMIHNGPGFHFLLSAIAEIDQRENCV